jgi:hypothetical protein
MKNIVLANQIGFDTCLLSEEGFQNRWHVFRGNENYKFIQLFMLKRIVEIQALLENSDPAQVLKLQGQISEARKLAAFLEQTAIANEINSMKAFLGLPK